MEEIGDLQAVLCYFANCSQQGSILKLIYGQKECMACDVVVTAKKQVACDFEPDLEGCNRELELHLD